MARKKVKRTTGAEAILSEQLARLKELEAKIGYRYRDISLLRNALVHSSYVNESGGEGLDDNERLEFVGDAVLEFIVSEHLYRSNPEESEGSLTVMRSSVVARKHCAAMAKELELGDYLLVGKGERKAAGGVKKSILANAFEALVASLYFDGGIKQAKRFILKMLERCAAGRVDEDENFKAQLQAMTQKSSGQLPSYRLTSSRGPAHERTFDVEVSINGVPYGKGKGATKKEAEQEAAKKALRKIAKEQAE
ncbi:ribonuclease III [bacterium]|nr:ribonuclease III [bacterium]